MNKILLFALLLPLAGIAQTPQVKTCDGKALSISSISVSSDAGPINTSACPYTPGELLDYLNCVAANNPLPAGSEYVLELEKDKQDYLNGVSTLDFVLVARHLIRTERFQKAAQTLAADMDGDNKVNIKDLIIMRSLILAKITELDTPSWQFFKSENLTLNGIGTDTQLSFPSTAFPLTELSIIGVKTGDVNASAL